MSKPKRVAISVIASTYYGREALRGILDYCTSYADWDIHHEGGTEAIAIGRLETALTRWKAQGMIVQLSNERVAKAVKRAGIPAVDIWHELDSTLPAVRTDDKAIGEMVAQYFHARGFVNYAWCTSRYDAHYRFVQKRREAFLNEAKRLGHSCSVYVDEHERSDDDWMSDVAQTQQWLRELPKPVAVMSCHDFRARSILLACSRIGLRVPEDVAVVGVDNDNIECNFARPFLSSVLLPLREIGFKAAEMLDKMLKGEKVPNKLVELKPLDVVTRQSSDTYAVDNPDIAIVLQYIAANASKPITVSDILDHTPISRRGMERKFRELLGTTPREHILYTHIEQAKRLLENTTLKLSAVAERSGFTPSQMFSRLFEQVVGVSPIDYRQRYHAHDLTHGAGEAD